MCAAIGWSVSLLTEPELFLLQRLAGFRGAFSPDDAQALAATHIPTGHLELLEQLVAAGLVAVGEAGGVTRYRMPKAVRDYVRGTHRD